MSNHVGIPVLPHPSRTKSVGAIAALLATIVLIAVGGTWVSSYDKTTGGQVGIVRNGGPLDNNNIRQYLPASSGRTFIGFFSKVHKYPAQQRVYTITSDPSAGDRSGVDVALQPTSDGVDVGVEGSLYFTLNTDKTVLSAFDNAYGTRTFGDANRHPWDGDQGFEDFLNTIVRPVIDNDLREQINNFRCSELVSSCALVQNNGGATEPVSAVSNNGNIAKVQDAINSSLATDLTTTLGGPYFTDIRFNLSKVTLPADVQAAVNSAQAAFAQVTEAQAKVEQAKADAAANEQRQQGYAQCPACAEIDTLKAIPPNVTVYAPGANTAVPLTASR